MQEEMTRKVASLESQMDARVNEAVQLALSQRATAGCIDVCIFVNILVHLISLIICSHFTFS